MSAWTGTGFTFFGNVEILPKSILFLRSLEQWVGGLGIVIIMIGVLIHSGTPAFRFYKSEAREEKIKPSVVNTLKKIVQIYLIYTMIGIILFVMAGMPIFDAVNNTFTALGTGGMSIKNANMGYYNNDIFYIISMLMMIMGATSFLTHYKIIKSKGGSFLRDIQFISMVIIIILATIVAVAVTRIIPMDVLYHVVSGITTTGANISSSTEIGAWPGFIKIILVVVMLIGGAAGSTAGGVKIIRIITILKGINKDIINIISPGGRIVNVKIFDKQLKESSIREASTYISLYLVFVLIGWLVLVSYDYDAMNSLVDIVSAESGVGITTGIMSPAMPIMAKLITIFNMWTGRLEIIPVLILLRCIIEIFKGAIPKKTLY
ncbi:potassium transporter TrkG [Methanobrevibacter sp. TMH8]|uniref:TrkH family potassium uptake protein n=1 Tax=Methanobrevibacter sp. TMH8 TaxID=2848611 RepID=UPI0021034325|nr:potassium transporter TrkG [Methanobrevibacter sp. TMH8]